jgi:hypothetical protein
MKKNVGLFLNVSECLTRKGFFDSMFRSRLSIAKGKN